MKTQDAIQLVQDNIEELRPHEKADVERIIGDHEGSYIDDDQMERLQGYASRFA